MLYQDFFKESESSLTYEEKLNIFKGNRRAAKKLAEEISKIKTSSHSSVTYTPGIEAKKKDEEQKPHPTLNDNPSFDTYKRISLLDISTLTEEEIITKIKEIIELETKPLAIYQLKLLLYKEYINYSKALKEAKSSKDISKLEEIIAALIIKINAIDEVEDEEEIKEEASTSINVFFLLTNTGSIVSLESIKQDIPKEYYSCVRALLMDIKNGTTKSVKRLKKVKMLQSRNLKIRVLFDKLSNGNYIIIDFLIKNLTTNYFYHSHLDLRSSQFLAKRNLYVEKSSDEDFIKEHMGYFTEILTLLDSKELERSEENVPRIN